MRLRGLLGAEWAGRSCARAGLTPALVAVLVAGLAIRLLWVVIHPVTPVSDFAEYNKHAANLAGHGVYSDNLAYRDAFWPPGWPAVLALVYLVAGVHPQIGAIAGTILEWGAIVVAAWAAIRLLAPRWATCAVVAMCLYPGAIAYGPVLGTEHLAAVLFTTAVVLVAFTRPAASTAFVIGLVEGALLLTRADYGLATAIVLAVWFWRGRRVHGILNFALIAILGALVCVGPWIARNALVFGEFIPTNTNGGETFYLGTLSARYTEPASVKRLRVTSTTKPGAHDAMYWRLAINNVEANPLRWLSFDAQRLYHQYGQETEDLHWGRIGSAAVKTVAYAYWLAIVVLALVGFVTALALKGRLGIAWAYIAGSVAVVSLLKTVFVVNQRDRLPLSYLLILIAGLGAMRVVQAASAGLKRGPHRGSVPVRADRDV